MELLTATNPHRSIFRFKMDSNLLLELRDDGKETNVKLCRWHRDAKSHVVNHRQIKKASLKLAFYCSADGAYLTSIILRVCTKFELDAPFVALACKR